LAEVWRGCGGSAGASPAAIKLFVRWDVLRGELQGPGLEQGHSLDQRGSFAVEDLPDGCLYVAGIVRYMQSGCRLNTRKTNPNTSQFLLGTPLVWPARKSQRRNVLT
jgi:hypothetical protein